MLKFEASNARRGVARCSHVPNVDVVIVAPQLRQRPRRRCDHHRSTPYQDAPAQDTRP